MSRRAAMSPPTTAAPEADLYLLPAVVGGGLGDIEEVLLAGRRLAAAGFRPQIFRPESRPAIRSLDGPWGFPALEAVTEIRPRHPRAITLSAWWGVSAGPGHPGAYGRPGSWSEETAAIEATYGRPNVLHVSFEEFARTLTSREQTIERWREGGRPTREIRRRLTTAAARHEEREFRAAFERYRATDRPEVLHLYPTFVRSRAFAREFPWAVQCGPFWPEPVRPVPRREAGRWIWYASPASSERLAAKIARAWDVRGRRIRIQVRAPREFPLPERPGLAWEWLRPMPAAAWRRLWASAELRIATGSRTLLESLADGGPFLYFNGVTGGDRSPRRHRPEKILALLDLWRRRRVDPGLRREMSDFSRMRSVGAVVRRARNDRAFAGGFPDRPDTAGFRPPYEDGGALVEQLAFEFARGRRTAAHLVETLRRGDGLPERRSETGH